MGTTKTGRVLYTRGAKGQASQYAVVHSNEGDYTKASKNRLIRLKRGGHGQAGMMELAKYGIEYHVEKRTLMACVLDTFQITKKKERGRECSKPGFRNHGRVRI